MFIKKAKVTDVLLLKKEKKKEGRLLCLFACFAVLQKRMNETVTFIYLVIFVFYLFCIILFFLLYIFHGRVPRTTAW